MTAVSHFIGAETFPAPGKLVLAADPLANRVARIGVPLTGFDRDSLAFTARSFSLDCTDDCPTGTLRVHNQGTARAPALRAVIVGDHPRDFRVAANDCGRRPLLPGRRCTVRIVFSPTVTCPTTTPCRHAVLSVTGGADGPREIPLAGTAVRQAPGMRTRADEKGSVATGFDTRDVASVLRTGTGGVPTGDVAFFLCGPLSSPSGCPAGRGEAISQNGLDAGGQAVSATVSRPGSPLSYYCWRAEYGGDRFYLPTFHTDATDECFYAGRAP